MCNSIFIDDKTLPKAKDGERVKLTVEGIYHTDEDGTRKLDVVEVDGREVISPEETDCGMDHEEYMNQDSEDALKVFLIKARKG